ncbi:MAG: hypothetical protein HY558_07180, partial [Euryarchaeota archaeon]|nr:hypothetical protein [Euryarchaeota archaeon]
PRGALRGSVGLFRRFKMEVFLVWLITGSLAFLLTLVSNLLGAVPGVGLAWLPFHYGLLIFVVEPLTVLWWTGLYRAFATHPPREPGPVSP